MMSFNVMLTADAEQDLGEIYNYIAWHDSPGRADHVLGQIEEAFESLSDSPDRGVYPGELLVLGIREYREVFFKPYRIIYRVVEKTVYILLIADGRRNMRTLLQQRILEG